jgi:hypothetical protein
MNDVELTAARSRDSKKGENVYVADTVSEAGIELHRRFSFFACLGLAFSLLNSWTGESPRASS